MKEIFSLGRRRLSKVYMHKLAVGDINNNLIYQYFWILVSRDFETFSVQSDTSDIYYFFHLQKLFCQPFSFGSIEKFAQWPITSTK